jgi:uncharacterized protein YbjT (DUF2867 family)
MNPSKTALVLGATGGIGGEVANQLRDAGWTVRALKRGAHLAQRRGGIEWVSGDAMNLDDDVNVGQLIWWWSTRLTA